MIALGSAGIVFVLTNHLSASANHLQASIPVGIGILAYFLLVHRLIRRDRLLKRSAFASRLFVALAMISMVSTTWVFFDSLRTIPLATSTHAYDGQPGSSSARYGELTRLDPDKRYFMDGSVDQWVYVLYKNGIDAIPYNRLPVQEKGTLYLYATLVILAGDFNQYLFILANCFLRLISAYLLFRIVAQFAGARPALGAAGLFLVFPETTYWISALHKDNVVIGLVMLAMWTGLRAYSRPKSDWLSATAFGIVLVLLAFTRSGLVLPLLVASAIGIVFAVRDRARHLLGLAITIVLAVAVIRIILPPVVTAELTHHVATRIYKKLDTGSTYGLDTQNITYRTSQEASLVRRFGGTDLGARDLYRLPIRIMMYFAAPFPPWFSGIASDRFVLPSAWIIVTLWLPFLAGVRDVVRSRPTAGIWALGFFLAMSIAVAFSGDFVYERYRQVLLPVYFALAALGVRHSTTMSATRLVIGSWIVFSVMLVLYWMLR